MRKQIIVKIMLLSMVSGVMCLYACQQLVAKAKPTMRHLAEVHKNGSVIYIDPADSRQVIKADSNEFFTAYKIGFEDNETGDKKREQERNVYYDFRMVNDWKAVVEGHSIAAFYFQPLTGLNKTNKEGILVFELPVGKHADTLVYTDSFGDWQKQIIALNPHLK